MEEDSNDPMEKKQRGCGAFAVYGNVFRRRTWVRRAASTDKIRRKTSPQLDSSRKHISHKPPKPKDSYPTARKSLVSQSSSSTYQSRKPIITNGKAVSGSISTMIQGRKYIKQSISRELDIMISERQVATDGSLVRVSSSNTMVFGHLGNLKQPEIRNENKGLNSLNVFVGSKGNPKLNNEDKGINDLNVRPSEVLCRALSKRLDPDELKEMGNEEYRKGKFAEALTFYDRAIVLDPNKASYRSNKAAALMGLGRLLEAVTECKEAIKTEPSYYRAHHRLGTLYLRLGNADKAIHHYRFSKAEASHEEMNRAKALNTLLNKCKEARTQKNWISTVENASRAISTAADSASQVFAWKGEALLKLLRHQEAEEALINAPPLDHNEAIKFFGATIYAYILLIQAQVDMGAGRFDQAIKISQQALQVDPNSKEVSLVAKKAQLVSASRSNGNEFFKESKFEEAYLAYTEGLKHEPFNAILLCNRAACRLKLLQLEEAINDCNKALNLRPSYSKALLRRADCYAKMEKWESCVQDYQILIKDMPGNDEVNKALMEARAHLAKLPLGEATVPITTASQSPEIVNLEQNDLEDNNITSSSK